jgi:HK97 family phage major capsid protein
LEKKDMSEENKANAFAEMSDWAIKNNLTEHLSKWMREGYTLDKAKAEAFDLRANAPKINIPLDVRAPEKVTKADHEELSLARTFNAVAQRGTSALLEEGKEYAKRMNISLAENEAFIPLDKAIFKRTMGIGQANGGANFAGTEYLTAEAALREGSVIGRAGVQILTGVNSLLTLPRVTTGSAFAWQSESGSLNDTDFTTISTQWSPKVATVSIPWSIALDALNQPYAIEDIARTDLMGALIEAFEGGVLAGTGANNQPTGLLNDPLIALVNSGSNGNFDSVRAAAMWSKQRGQHGSQNNFTYIVTPTVFAGAMTRVQFSGSFQPALTVTGPGVGLTNGYTVLNSTFVSTALYTNACVAGDFSKVLSTVFGIKIIRDDWNGLPNATVKLRGILMMDSKARQPLSLVRDVNITG